MSWITLAIVSALFYGSYHFFIKLASGHMHQVLAALILQSSALVVGACLFSVLKWSGQSVVVSGAGIRLAILAGVCVGAGEICSFYLFSRGVPATQGVPIIVGGAVAAASFFGYIFLREALSVFQVTGIILIVTGVAMLTSKGHAF